MIAAIMCGGLGSRMGAGEEKPLIKLGDRHLIEHVATALHESKSFTRIVAAVSPNTPRTKEFLHSLNVDVIDTPGDGYSSDLSRLLAALAPDKVMVVPADLPLLTPQIVREIIDVLSTGNTPAASIVMDRSFVEGLGVTPSVVIGDMCHSGITLFDAGRVGSNPVDEQHVKMNRVEIAVNVNTKKEKELAELLLVQHAQDLARDKGL